MNVRQSMFRDKPEAKIKIDPRTRAHFSHCGSKLELLPYEDAALHNVVMARMVLKSG